MRVKRREVGLRGSQEVGQEACDGAPPEELGGAGVSAQLVLWRYCCLHSSGWLGELTRSNRTP